MGDPSKVLLFGSFTEDETKCLLSHGSSNAAKSNENIIVLSKSSNGIPELSFVSNGESHVRVCSHNESGNSHPSEELKQSIFTGATPSGECFQSGSDNGKTLLRNCYDKVNQVTENGNDFPAKKVFGNGCEEATSKLLDFGVAKLNGSTLVKDHNEVTHWRTVCPIVAAPDILPRSLVNSGNLCFLNATLQALLSCSPFILLLQRLQNCNIPKVGYPTLTAFMEFISEFDVTVRNNTKKKEAVLIETGRSFSPVMFESVLKIFTPDVPCSISGRSRQEDAQEFLSFILHQMHDELLKFEGQSHMDGKEPSLVSVSEDDEWETVGPKNTSALTITHKFYPSELSKIFGGQLQSVVKAKGNKASATVQPFLLLPLDISDEAIRSIDDALRSFSAPEVLEGYRVSIVRKAGNVSARKSVKMQSLPKIMILHLKRFGYGIHGSTKLHKPVNFPLELVIGRQILVSATSAGRTYKLVSTITHHGREASKGHYTADVCYPNGHWLRFDDASITAIGTSEVLHNQAYVLFYKQV